MLTCENLLSSRASAKIVFWLVQMYLVLGAMAHAEGMIDISPHLGVSAIHDDNVFRFSSSQQARQQLGSDAQSDFIKRAEFGLDAKLRFSRQLFALSSNIANSTYNRFSRLDNTGSSFRLGWEYQIGNHIRGELSTSQSKSLAGFNEIRTSQRNIRTSIRQMATVNWNYHPDWTVYGAIQRNALKNDQASFQSVDREDDIYLAGIRYTNPRGTQLTFSYQLSNAEFPKREDFARLFFGDDSRRKELAVSASWNPISQVRLTTQLSRIELAYEDVPERGFRGTAQQLGLDYQFSEKSSVQISVYQSVSPIDDVISTYVKSRGISISPVWRISEKLAAQMNVGYETRDYLGSAGFFNLGQNDRNDESRITGMTLRYLPTQHATIALEYNGEDRDSNIQNFDYRYKQLSLNMQYHF